MRDVLIYLFIGIPAGVPIALACEYARGRFRAYRRRNRSLINR